MADWYSDNQKRILSRLAGHAEHAGKQVILSRPHSMHQLSVEKHGHQIELIFFGDESNELISRMDVRDPLNLLSPYTQAMMLALLWASDPRRVYMLGFGAGRVPMILHHYSPDVRIECTELDEDVVDVAKSHFGIVLDHRLKVVVEDGRKYLERKSELAEYDVLYVDAFRGTGNSPFPLATREFYQLCKRHLAPDGIISVNLLMDDRFYNDKVATFGKSFHNVYLVRVAGGGSILFGTDGENVSIGELIDRAQQTQERHGFVFPLVKHAKNLQQLVAAGEVVSPRCRGRILADEEPPQALSLPNSACTGTGRNDPCPCGSGRKFKKCHGDRSKWRE